MLHLCMLSGKQQAPSLNLSFCHLRHEHWLNELLWFCCAPLVFCIFFGPSELSVCQLRKLKGLLSHNIAIIKPQVKTSSDLTTGLTWTELVIAHLINKNCSQEPALAPLQPEVSVPDKLRNLSVNLPAHLGSTPQPELHFSLVSTIGVFFAYI